MFTNRALGKYIEFEQSLLQYITIVAPIIWSLWLLEAAHANAADVFVFWLASAATLRDLFAKGTAVTGIPTSLAEAVMSIFNKRYKEFFANEIYFITFMLDPHVFSIFKSLLLHILHPN